MGALLLGGALLTCASAARAEPRPKTAPIHLSGTALLPDVPYSISLAELNQSYFRLIVGSGADRVDLENQKAIPRGGLEFGLYFTRGAVVTMGSQSYLVAYRPEARLDPRNFSRDDDLRSDDSPLGERKLSPKAKLVLSLLNLRSTAGLNEIRPFDTKQDVQTQAEAINATDLTLQRLGAVALEALRDERQRPFPPLTPDLTEDMRSSLGGGSYNAGLWVNPLDNRPFQINPALSYKFLSRITNPGALPLFYESAPSLDGSRGVVFLDGRVARISEKQWGSKLKTAVAERPGIADPPPPKPALPEVDNG